MTANIHVLTLGCSKNLVDSENIMGVLEREGYTIVENPNDSDVIIVNTCGFIELAKQESIEAILRVAKIAEKKKDLKIIVSGCLAQKYADELLEEIPEIDGITGTGNVARIAEVVGRVLAGDKAYQIDVPRYSGENLPRKRATPLHYAYLKIAEGCSNYCSYCAIPSMRGPYISRPMESVVAEAEQMVASGVKELLIVAQDTTKYGEDLYGKPALANLLKKIARIEELEWIRLLYCYPTHFNEELIEVVASESKICKYLDIPLQHASDEILSRMNRPHGVQEARRLIHRLRKFMPDITLRSTFIVGFPGESEQDFDELLCFLEEIKFDWAGFFAYSREDGTPAARMPNQIPEEIMEERYHRATILQREITAQRNARFVGRIIPVLLEGKSTDFPEYFQGRSTRQAPEVDGVVLIQGKHFPTGKIVPVRVEKAEDYDLIGAICNESGQ